MTPMKLDCAADCKMKPHVLSRQQRGFTMIELLIVMAVLMITIGIGFITLQPAIQQIRVTNAYNTTLMTMRRAREISIGQRRTYIVTFNNAVVPNTVTIAPASATPGGLNVVYSLPNDVIMTTMATYPNPGPDGFGIGTTAIDFDQAVGGGIKTSIYFNPDGSAQDVNNNINNGVIYMGRTGQLYSSTAITLWGATGRLRGWKLVNVGGVPTWKQQ
jgi:prepilin-type N-terminal cleavage/methylation domain-containing protein